MLIVELYQTVAGRLLKYLVANGCAEAQAEDIVQETFLRLVKMSDELETDPARLSGLVYTIARNYRIDLIRKSKREVLQEEITDETARIDQVTASPLSFSRPVEVEDENAALRQKLDAALAKLPPTLREAFTLFQLGELSIREIAMQTQVSESNVKVRIHRAKEKLREMLKS